MPSDDLLLYFKNDSAHLGALAGRRPPLQSNQRAVLQNMDNHRTEIEPILARTYGAEHVRRWWVYWRVFFMSCAEFAKSAS